MRNVSNEYRQTMERRQDFYFEAEISFQNGDRKTLKKDDFSIPGNSVVESAGSSSFPLGVVCSKQLLISIINDDDKWSEYDFYYAKIFLKIKFDLDNGTTETLNIGTFTVITPETYGVTIELAAMDDGYKLDKDYSTGLTYPLSLGAAFRDSCSTCGVSVLTSTIPNENYMISKKPENVTHRQFIGLCAMIAGGNAGFDEYNRLKFLPYDFSEFEKAGLDGGKFDSFGTGKYQTGDSADGGSFYPWKAGYEADGGVFGDRNNVHILYDFKNGMKVGVDDVVITGVQIADKDKNVFLYGSEGYVLSLENQLAEGREEIVSGLIGEKIVGLRFRPFTGDHISYPLAEFMDLAYIFDEKNNMYQTILTDVDFQCYGFTTLKCSADSPIRNSSKYYGNETKAIVEANRLVEKEKTEREKALENLSQIINESSGLYTTEEVQEDESVVFYMHNKPALSESNIVWKMTAESFAVSTDGGSTWNAGITVDGDVVANILSTNGVSFDWARGGTLTLGGINNRSGKMEVLDSDGNIISNITNNGIAINKGVLNILTDSKDKKTIRIGYGNPSANSEYLYTEITPTRFQSESLNSDGYLSRMASINYDGIRFISQKDNSESKSASLDVESVYCKNFSASNLDMYSTATDVRLIGLGIFESNHKDFRLKGVVESARTSEAPNMYISPSAGQIRVSSESSSRYKNISRVFTDSDINPLYSISPIWAKYKDGYLSGADERNGVEYPMFIAEDVEKYAPLAVDHDADGRAKNWNYRVMIPYMFQMIKSQKEEIDKLSEKIDELEKKTKGD